MKEVLRRFAEREADQEITKHWGLVITGREGEFHRTLYVGGVMSGISTAVTLIEYQLEAGGDLGMILRLLWKTAEPLPPPMTGSSSTEVPS